MPPDKIADIKEISQNISLARIKSSSKRDDLKFTEVDTNLAVLAYWMSFVLVSGESIRIIFKAHFSSSDAQILASSTYDSKPENVSFDQAFDFMKEFCNLVAGGIKKKLEDSGLSAGISLPILVRGFDEFFFTGNPDKKIFFERWKISGDQVNLFCSLQLEFIDLDKIKNTIFDKDISNLDDDSISFF